MLNTQKVQLDVHETRLQVRCDRSKSKQLFHLRLQIQKSKWEKLSVSLLNSQLR